MFVMKRFPHIIPQKKTSVIPSNFVFFDTETKVDGSSNGIMEGKHRLWFGWAYAFRLENGKRTRQVWCRFTTSQQFFDFIKSRCSEHKPLFVYAHNLGFDLPIVGFFTNFKSNDFKPEFYTFESPPTIFKCTWNKHTICFVDTLNYWTISLAKLGESIGHKKTVMPISRQSKKQWDTYCRNDVEVIADAVMKLCQFVINHKCGGVGLTLASLAMYAYRHAHMKHDIYIHDRIKVCELERSAYYGGLVNAYFIGKVRTKQVYSLDINSHYSAMMMNSFPVKLVDEWKGVTLKHLESLVKRYCVIANVCISSKSETFPVKYKNKLVYAKGVFSTTLCGPELERAIKHKCILKVFHTAVYERAAIFRSFVKYFWELRLKYQQENNHVDSLFAKILMNSLYGKFGQRGVSWFDLTEQLFNKLKEIYGLNNGKIKYELKDVPQIEFGYKPWTPESIDEPLYLRNVMSGLQIKLGVKEHHESFPAISAYVTSYGREFLINLLRIAGKGNYFYCDTDSLFVNHKGFTNLKKAKMFGKTELGKLKLVGKSPVMNIRGLKDYSFKDKEVIKGIRHDAIPLAKNTFEQTRFDGIKSILRREDTSYVEVKRIIKVLKRTYDKGRVLSSGWVEPLTLSL